MKEIILVAITMITFSLWAYNTGDLTFNTNEKHTNNEVCEMIPVDTVAQVILFKDQKGALYVTTKYRKSAYNDICEPLMQIKGEAERMCETRHKVPPNNSLTPKKATYSGNVNGLVYKTTTHEYLSK